MEGNAIKSEDKVELIFIKIKDDSLTISLSSVLEDSIKIYNKQLICSISVHFVKELQAVTWSLDAIKMISSDLNYNIRYSESKNLELLIISPLPKEKSDELIEILKGNIYDNGIYRYN